MAISTLGVKAGMDVYGAYFVSDLDEALRILEMENYITINHGTDTTKPTYKGLEYARLLMRPWNKRAWDWLKGDLRTVIFAVITAVITAVATTWLLQLLGWK